VTYDDLLASLNPAAWWKLDETSGSSAADSSGHGHTGTYQGSPTLGVAGPFPGAKGVSLVPDQGVTTGWEGPASTGALTLVAWYKGMPSNWAPVICGSNEVYFSNQGTQLIAGTLGGATDIDAWVGTSGGSQYLRVNNSSVADASSWHMLVLS